MLLLTRKSGESVIIDKKIKISVLDIRRDHIKIGIEAPKDVNIFREEIFLRIQAQQNQTDPVDLE